MDAGLNLLGKMDEALEGIYYIALLSHENTLLSGSRPRFP